MHVTSTWQATSSKIRLDTKELEDAQWFSREEVAGARELVAVPLPNEATSMRTEEGQANISIPGPYAIAHHLYVQDRGEGEGWGKRDHVCNVLCDVWCVQDQALAGAPAPPSAINPAKQSDYLKKMK